MKIRSITFTFAACSLALATAGCMKAPGKPGMAEATPAQVMDFATLYKQNCAACHGDNGKGGAAISLANPVYLATAGIDNLQNVTANGVAGTLMPGFGKKAGGMLTDAQVGAISQGMIAAWGSASALGGATPPSYSGQDKGTAANFETAYKSFCASCHGSDGTGIPGKTGSIVDPAYLALISDQGLRSIVIAGRPDIGMPDWRGDAQGRAMTEEDVSDVVSWLASQRTASPGEPYPQQK